MVAALRRGAVMASLLAAPCGCQVLDQVALMQARADLQADFDAESSAAANLVHALGLDAAADEGRPSLAMVKSTLDSSVNIYNNKVNEDRAVMGEIAQKLASAFIHEVEYHMKAGNPIFAQDGLLRKAESFVNEKKKAIQDVLASLAKGGLQRSAENWVTKMVNATVDMAKQFMDKNEGVRNLLSGSLMLESQKVASKEAYNDMMAASLISASGVSPEPQPTEAGDVLSKAWQTETLAGLKAPGMAEKAVAGIKAWVDANTKDGKPTPEAMEYITYVAKLTAATAMKWMGESTDFQKLVAGAFLNMERQTGEGSVDPSVVAQEIEILKKRVWDIQEQQSKLSDMKNDALKWENWVPEHADSVHSVEPKDLAALRKAMDETTSLAENWSQNTKSLLHLTATYFHLAAQTNDVPADLTADVERILLEQERLVHVGPEMVDQKALVVDGQFSADSVPRVQTILDDTSDRAYGWMSRSGQIQGLAGAALKKIALAKK